MRKIKLWNYMKTSSLDLNSNKFLVSDLTGFGTDYKLIGEGELIHAIEVEFEPVTLKINFGVCDNAYTCYKEFVDFIIINGKNKLILEYNYNGSPRYCDVYLESAPKTQKNNYNVISETFRFKRLTPWYEDITVELPINETYFIDVLNNYLLPIAFNFESNKGTGNIDIQKSIDEVFIGRISVSAKSGYKLKIDSEEKQVYFYNDNEVINAYDNINHIYDSFLYAAQGMNVRIRSLNNDELKINYKKWVAD